MNNFDFTQYETTNNSNSNNKKYFFIVLTSLTIGALCYYTYSLGKKESIKKDTSTYSQITNTNKENYTKDSISKNSKEESNSVVELQSGIFYSKTTGTISIEKDIESLSIVNGDVVVNGKVVKSFKSLGNNIVSINGNSVSIEGNGQSVSIINDVVYVNGKKVSSPSPQQKENEEVLNKIIVNGSVRLLKTVSHDVVVLGGITGSISTISGDIFASTINGDAQTMSGDVNNISTNSNFTGTISVTGSVGSLKTTSGNITVKGIIGGSVETMSGDITAKIKGNTSTMSGGIY